MKAPRTIGNPQTEASGRMAIEQIGRVLGGNVSFGATTGNTDRDINMDCFKTTGTSPVGPNTEFAVAHNLKRIPIAYLVGWLSKAAKLYQGPNTGTAWTAATAAAQGNIFIKCDVASVDFFIIII